MGMTIAQVSQRTGLSTHTLRYYEKEGLLPFVERTPSGTRSFKESDLEWLGIVICLKRTGMPVRDIKQFIDWCQEGDSTLEQRLNVFLEQRQSIEQQMLELQSCLATIDRKIDYYQTAVEAGTEGVRNRKNTQCAT